MSWLKVELNPEIDYCVGLYQDKDRRRFCRVIDHADVGSSEDLVFYVGPIPSELIDKYKTKVIENTYKLNDGNEFAFGPHGDWFTLSELDQMRAYDLGEIKTVTWATKDGPYTSVPK